MEGIIDMAKKILVVDDEKPISDIIKFNLEKEGYEVVVAYDGEAALEQVEAENPDLIILDLMLPKIDGLEVAKRVRAKHTMPIIMVTAKDSELDKVLGLELGADDYVTKPFNPLEVMARVKSLLRRSQGEVTNDQPDILNVGPLLINKDSHEVKTIKGDVIQLTALEFGILYLLASHPNRVFSVDDIFERVWQQESVVSAKTVMVHVSHLRDKIEEATNGEKVIQTVWGVGYKVEDH